MLDRVTIHKDKRVSRETARLLGMMFTWAEATVNGLFVYRYAPTEQGPELQCANVHISGITPWRSQKWVWPDDDREPDDLPYLATIEGEDHDTI